MEIPLFVLAFWTAIKKLDSPVANPANQLGCILLYDILFLVLLSRSFIETA